MKDSTDSPGIAAVGPGSAGNDSTAGETGESSRLRSTLTRVAWLSIALGLVIQGLLIAARFGAFSTDAALAELVNRVSWAVLVCMGLAIGDALTGDKPMWMGLSGLLAAPIAFTVSRALHKGAAEVLGADAPADSIDPLLAGSIRGLEYMCLALALYWLGRRLHPSVFAYIGAGMVIGLVFGSLLLALNPETMSSTSRMLVWGVNEVIFPAGCCLVIYAASALGGKLAK